VVPAQGRPDRILHYPGAVFSYEDKGEKKELETAQIFIEVKSVIEDKEAATDIKEIKPLETIKRNYAAIALYVLAGAVVLVVILGGIYWYRFKFKKAKAVSPGLPMNWRLKSSSTSGRRV